MNQTELVEASLEWVWVPHKTLRWQPAHIERRLKDKSVSTKTLGGQQMKITAIRIMKIGGHTLRVPLTPLKRFNLDIIREDLVDLDSDEVNEGAILHNTRIRYEGDKIYTWIGADQSVLVAMNPYRDLGLYTMEYKKKFQKLMESKKGTATRVEPHVFGVAAKCVDTLINRPKSQSILVSGESGAGKTQATKQCLDYIAFVAGSTKAVKAEEKVTFQKKKGRAKKKQKKLTKAQQRRLKREQERKERELAMAGGAVNVDSAQTAQTIENKILQCNPIMEAFGNAKTVRNNNSSRFGKWVCVYMDRKKKRVQYAKITPFLLETTRVIHQAANERAYHIFYQIFTDEELRTRFELTTPEDYYYANQGNCVKVITDNKNTTIDDAQEFLDLKKAMESMGFEKEEQEWYFEVSAALLHLGNIKFKKVPKPGDGRKAELENKDNLASASKLLGIEVDRFEQVLLEKTLNVRGEVTVVYNTAKKAEGAKASLAKAIYGKMFNVLIDRINESFGSGSSTKFIGILDIFGFENFKVNSFEQLCINFTNERLQKVYIDQTYVQQQETYKTEKIKFTPQKFESNNQVLSLIKGKPDGILPRLDDECKVSGGSEEQFLRVINGLHRDKMKKIFKCNEKVKTFEIKHFAEKVTYRVENFLVKNIDSLNQDLYDICSESTNFHTKMLFPKLEENERVKIRSTSAKFREQLEQLCKALDETQTHYIRCIKPNHEQVYNKFDGFKINDQMNAVGIIDTIVNRQKGFEFQLSHSNFAEMYAIAGGFKFKKNLNLDSIAKNKRQGACEKIISEVFKTPLAKLEGIQVGLVHIFFRRDEYKFLEINRAISVTEELLPRIQGIVRGVLTRNFYRAFKQLKADLTKCIEDSDLDKLNEIEKTAQERLGRLGKRYKLGLGGLEQAREKIKMNLMWDPIEDKMEKYDDVGLIANGDGIRVLERESLADEKYMQREIIEEMIREVYEVFEKSGLDKMPEGVQASFNHLKKVSRAVIDLQLRREYEEQKRLDEEAKRKELEAQRKKEQEEAEKKQREEAEAAAAAAAKKSSIIPVEVEQDETSKKSSVAAVDAEVKSSVSKKVSKAVSMNEQNQVAAALNGEVGAGDFNVSNVDLFMSSPDFVEPTPDNNFALARQFSSNTAKTKDDNLDVQVESLEEFANMNQEHQAKLIEQEAKNALKAPERKQLREVLVRAAEYEHSSDTITQVEKLLKANEVDFVTEKLKRLKEQDNKALASVIAGNEILLRELKLIAEFDKYKYIHRISTLRNPPEEIEYITCFCIPIGSTVREEELNEGQYGESAKHRLDNKKRKFLKWQNHDFLDYSLLRLPKSLEETCVDTFSHIFGYMENDSLEGDEEGLEVIKVGLFQGGGNNTGLRNEIFIQIVKQLIDNPSQSSRIRGVELLGLCLASFSPDDEEMNNFLLVWLCCNLSYAHFRQYVSAMNMVQYKHSGKNSRLKKDSDLSDVRAELESVLQSDNTPWSGYSLRPGVAEKKWKDVIPKTMKRDLVSLDAQDEEEESILRYEEEESDEDTESRSLLGSAIGTLRKMSSSARSRLSSGKKKNKNGADFKVDANVE
eukprot:augustus_masked-scaffold_1-processed-gene-9.6-mRNA-1 protein AED:0.35 eAED:0.40 QI:0/-1/0/1/-1/1/1/0/1570